MVAKIILGILLAAASLAAMPRYNGVSFCSLDGWGGADDEKWPEVLDNIADTGVQARLRNTFRAYRESGIDLIRLIIAPQWPGFNCLTPPKFQTNGEYPIPSEARIRSVNTFMDIASAYGVKFSVTFGAPKVWQHNMLSGQWDLTHLFMDPPPYSNDKQWLAKWINGLDHRHIALFNLADEVVVHAAFNNGFRYYPDRQIERGLIPNNLGKHVERSPSINNAAYALEIWNWYRSRYSQLPVGASFEFSSWEMTSAEGVEFAHATPRIVMGYADWILANMPDISCASLEFYFMIDPMPANPSAYQSYAANLFSAYYRSPLYNKTRKPLWIDEYGYPVCLKKCSRNEDEQACYYEGFLSAAHQYNSSELSGIAAWSGANDLPFTTIMCWGLVRSYANNNPICRPAMAKMPSILRSDRRITVTSAGIAPCIVP